MTAFSKKYYRSTAPLIQPESLARRPLDWPEIFGNSAPLELEIGFGNGEYLHRQSLENPNRNYVGVEIAWASAKRALRRLATPPRSNVRILLIKAETALERFFAEESLCAISALFPVPWPYERHEKRRLFSHKFLSLAANRLKAQGSFNLLTDNEPLAQWTLEQSTQSALEFVLEKGPSSADTKYERKWQSGGQEYFYQLTGRKKFHPPVVESWGEVEMQAYYRESFNPDNFKPLGCTIGDTVVRFKEFIFDQNQNKGLLRTLVVEDNLAQEFFIKIGQEGNRWKFSPAISSHIFPTKGVAQALELAAADPGQ